MSTDPVKGLLRHSLPADNAPGRTAFKCPDCGCIKDGWDTEKDGLRQAAWCHNRRHETSYRRKMQPVVLVVRPSEDAVLCSVCASALKLTEEDKQMRDAMAKAGMGEYRLVCDGCSHDLMEMPA